MLIDDRQAMSAAYKAQIEKLGIPISAGRYRELREYADENRIRISGFRNFVGDIETIKKILDDIYEIGQDFPKILDERAGVVLELDYDMDDEDFNKFHTDLGFAMKVIKHQKEDADEIIKDTNHRNINTDTAFFLNRAVNLGLEFEESEQRS